MFSTAPVRSLDKEVRQWWTFLRRGTPGFRRLLLDAGHCRIFCKACCFENIYGKLLKITRINTSNIQHTLENKVVFHFYDFFWGGVNVVLGQAFPVPWQCHFFSWASSGRAPGSLLAVFRWPRGMPGIEPGSGPARQAPSLLWIAPSSTRTTALVCLLGKKAEKRGWG